MIIVLATDDNFVQHCGVTMISILKHNLNVEFFLLIEGLKEDNLKSLTDLVHNNGGKLNICMVPCDVVKYFPMSKMASSHISIATYYRLFIASLLPESVEKAIYLDCDIVIRGSLEELWNTDLTEYALGVVYQDFGWSDQEKSWDRLHIPRECGYFNAGSLLLNLYYMRKDNFQAKAIQFINENFDYIVSHDQDVLNAIYYQAAFPISCKWNYTSIFMTNSLKSEDFPSKYDYPKEISSAGFSPIIIHFVSKPKPWHWGCSHKYKQDYYYYLSMTEWAGFKPTFKINAYFKDVVIPSTKRIIKSLDKFHLIDRIKDNIF